MTRPSSNGSGKSGPGSLPALPNLKQQKLLAKELLEAWRARHWREHHDEELLVARILSYPNGLVEVSDLADLDVRMKGPGNSRCVG